MKTIKNKLNSSLSTWHVLAMQAVYLHIIKRIIRFFASHAVSDGNTSQIQYPISPVLSALMHEINHKQDGSINSLEQWWLQLLINKYGNITLRTGPGRHLFRACLWPETGPHMDKSVVYGVIQQKNTAHPATWDNSVHRYNPPAHIYTRPE